MWLTFVLNLPLLSVDYCEKEKKIKKVENTLKKKKTLWWKLLLFKKVVGE